MTKLQLSNHTCFLKQIGSGKGPVVLLPISDQEAAFLEVLGERLSVDCNGILAAFTVENWFRDLTPWPAHGAFGNENFEGRGEETLSWIKNEFIPILQEFDEDFYISGYSLGGLFSLWALLKVDLFRGCASCSGSLWYPGWDEYLKASRLPEDGLVYLSLGTHEERTRNPIMCRVGDSTRALADRCEREGLRYNLEWNPGGHFRDVNDRLEKGLRWIFQNAMSL